MDPTFIALSILILLFSVIVHEVMHGLVALHFGDHTAEDAGRLTLNPIPHIDPIGTILLPAVFLLLPLLTGVQSNFFIAWAKPVPVNPLNFSNIRLGELLVSAAGIIANFVLALICALIYHVVSSPGNSSQLSTIFQYGVAINLMLGIFNLLPIPPLDGSKILLSQLPYQAARAFDQLSQYGFLILILLLYFNVVGVVFAFILPPLYSLLGVPPL